MARVRTKQSAESIAKGELEMQRLAQSEHDVFEEVLNPVSTPTTVHEHIQIVEQGKPASEITLRDQFALAAIQGLLASPSGYRGTTPETWKLYARDAYNIADAMVAQRNSTT